MMVQVTTENNLEDGRNYYNFLNKDYGEIIELTFVKAPNLNAFRM